MSLTTHERDRARTARHKAILSRPIHDFSVEDHGTIQLLVPNTDRAIAWRNEHLPSDAMTWGKAVVVEPRYIADIVQGIQNDGLTVD